MATSFAPPQAATAQAVVLKAEDIPVPLATVPRDAAVLYLNGTTTEVLSGPALDDQHLIEAGATSKYILALLTLRLSDAGMLDLAAPVSSILSDVVPAEPFERPITIQHLLNETAGFATPPRHVKLAAPGEALSGIRLRRFAIKMRSAGQISAHDPVGWAVLANVLETISGQPIEALIKAHVTTPLGLPEDAFELGSGPQEGFGFPPHVRASPQFFAEVLRLLIRNRDQHGAPYLNRESYNRLVGGAGGFRLHPTLPIIGTGLAHGISYGHLWVSPAHQPCNAAVSFAAYPQAGTVFIAFRPQPSGGMQCLGAPLLADTQTLAHALFPPLSVSNQPPPSSLREPSQLGGRYVAADSSPAMLRDRLDLMQGDWIDLSGFTPDGITLRQADGTSVQMGHVAPYHYTKTTAGNLTGDSPTADNPGPTHLILSPFKLGGYAVVDGALYRRVDFLGVTALFERFLPYALMVVMTAGVYLLRRKNKPWRNMALFALAGAALVGGGIYLELTRWADILYTDGQPWVITLWRAGINIGLMALLALPMFAISFSRDKSAPAGLWGPLAQMHLSFVSAAAAVIFLTLVFWGVAGTFAPY